MQAIFDCPEKAVEYCQNYRRNLPAFARRSFDFKPSRVVRLDQQAHFALLQRRSGRGLVLWARVERLHVNHFYMSFSFQFLEVVLYFLLLARVGVGLVLPMEVPFPASNAERSLLYHSPPPDNPESALGAKENSLNDVG